MRNGSNRIAKIFSRRIHENVQRESIGRRVLGYAALYVMSGGASIVGGDLRERIDTGITFGRVADNERVLSFTERSCGGLGPLVVLPKG